MNTDLMFSSKSSEWETPPELFRQLDDIFHFTIDLAASPGNALCKRYYTIKDNALKQSWQGETGYLNPPYGREIKYWIKKACEAGWIADSSSDLYPHENYRKRTTIVVLMPGRIDTKWMQDYVYGDEKKGAKYILDVRGRLKFDNPLMEWETPDPAPFPSRLAFFGDVYESEIKEVAKLELGQLIKPIYL